jgi:hypothetical protein
MAASPQWKVYIGKEYVASVKDPTDGAAILAWHHSEGNTLRFGHEVAYWTEGVDGWASESYDEVADKAIGRQREASRKQMAALGLPEGGLKQ